MEADVSATLVLVARAAGKILWGWLWRTKLKRLRRLLQLVRLVKRRRSWGGVAPVGD